MRYFLQFLLFISLLLMVGCAMPITPRYSVSAKNVVELRTLYGNSSNKIKIGEITTEIKELSCRGTEIKIPDGLTIASFVKNGFSDELKLAGVYSDKSNIELSGRIKNLDVECNFGTGKWITEIEISIGPKHTFIVKNVSFFEGTYSGIIVYNNAQQSLNPALQDLFWLIIKHPDFNAALNTPN